MRTGFRKLFNFSKFKHALTMCNNFGKFYENISQTIEAPSLYKVLARGGEISSGFLLPFTKNEEYTIYILTFRDSIQQWRTIIFYLTAFSFLLTAQSFHLQYGIDTRKISIFSLTSILSITPSQTILDWIPLSIQNFKTRARKIAGSLPPRRILNSTKTNEWHILQVDS